MLLEMYFIGHTLFEIQKAIVSLENCIRETAAEFKPKVQNSDLES